MATDEPAEAKRLFMENLVSAVAQSGPRGTHVALILIEISPRGGSGTGGNPAALETELRELLRAVQAHCGRDNDRVLRLSHDRIAAVCPDTDAAGASHVAARIREAALFLPSRRGLPLPLAIGAAVSGPESGDHAADIMARAEHTLASARSRVGPLISVTGSRPRPRKTATLLERLCLLFRRPAAGAERRGGR